MSDRVLILHGWGGSDAPHWQSELASEIAKNYGTVSFPLLDNCHFPSKNRWVKQVKRILKEFKPTTVVCHSLANTLWFWLCQEEMIEVERLIMVSPPSLSTTEATIKTFFPCAIPQNIYAKEIELIVSDSDPWINLDEAKEMADSVGAKYQVIKDAGHINADSGYGKWNLIENLIFKT
ncbi:MAG TPA: serine hydrolase family protein [Campylobacterales bacterium]|nr:serine hydrolase family protein [Campylobacterales bacterium]